MTVAALGGCVEADLLGPGIGYAIPDRTSSVPYTVPPTSGLAVVDSNLGQTLHVFSDGAGPGRSALVAAPSGAGATTLSVSVQPGMPTLPEQWRVVVQDDGEVWLQQAALGKCLDDGLGPDGGLALATCGGANTRWRLVPVLYSDLARVRNGATGQCMTLNADGSALVMGPCTSAAVWRFELLSGTGAALTGQGYGTVQVTSKGALSTLGSASFRPCTDATVSNPTLEALNWLQISNGGDNVLALDRVDGQANVVSLGSLEPHASGVLQVPAGSLVRVSTAGQCLGFVDTAVMLRVNPDGSFLAQGGALHLCQEQNALHSLNSRRRATLRVLNNSAAPLTFNWLSYTAGEPANAYGTVANGNVATIYTFQTHPWMLTAADGACRGILTLNPDPQP